MLSTTKSFMKCTGDNPFTPNCLSYMLEDWNAIKGIDGIFEINNYEIDAEVFKKFVNVPFCPKNYLYFIKLKGGLSDETSIRFILHECMHLFYPFFSMDKEEYWEHEEVIEAEVEKTFNNYREIYLLRYQEHLNDKRIPKIIRLENDKIPDLDNILVDNFNEKKRRYRGLFNSQNL